MQGKKGDEAPFIPVNLYPLNVQFSRQVLRPPRPPPEKGVDWFWQDKQLNVENLFLTFGAPHFGHVTCFSL
ncbi:MAG: hypothetical protein MZV70_44965 [Desulfobacterales bacterium]|nr:hypothetical protein [Desulfobacterales bacterium]